MNLFLVRSHIHNKATIRDRFVWWDCQEGNKVDSVRTLNTPANALGQAAKFIRCGTVPGGECLFIRYESSVFHVGAFCGVNECICHGDRVDRVCVVLRRLGACAESWGLVALTEIHKVTIEIGALYAKIELGGGVL
jgi:hypothetical protein